jgi:hypothetical protein
VRVASLAGVVSSDVERVVLADASGQRSVPIATDTGAFVVVATGGAFQLALRSRVDELLDTLSHSSPPE